MPAKSGKQYVDWLNERQTNIWIDGKRIQENISDHPAFKGIINSQASLYDLQHDKNKKGFMTYTSPTSKDPVGISFLEPKTKEDLEKRRVMIQEWSRAHHGLMGRSPDYMNTIIMAYAAAADVFAEKDQTFAKNVINYYEYCRENDITLTHTFIKPQVNRSQLELEDPNNVIAAKVIDQTDDGIIIQGALLLATQGGSTDEIMVRSIGNNWLDFSGDNPYAYTFCIPNDTPGLKFICRESFDYGKSNWDHPLSSRFEEMDTMVVFDHVVVPWDRVFLCGDNSLANRINNEVNFFEHVAHQCVSRNVIKTEFLLGILQAMIDTINVGEYQHIHEKVSELAIALEAMKGFLYLSEHHAKVNKRGTMVPDKNPLLAAINYYPRVYPRFIEIIQTVGASGLVSLPSDADFKSELRSDLDKYLQGANSDAYNRVKLFRLAWDISMSAFGSRQVQYERFFFGDPVRLAGSLYNEYERENLVNHIVK